jgi:hypothetical protein
VCLKVKGGRNTAGARSSGRSKVARGNSLETFETSVICRNVTRLNQVDIYLSVNDSDNKLYLRQQKVFVLQLVVLCGWKKMCFLCHREMLQFLVVCFITVN